jgi:hypothetical protein
MVMYKYLSRFGFYGFLNSLVIFLSLISSSIYAQDCQSTLVINLKNIRGGIYENEEVSLIPQYGEKLIEKSDALGQASFLVTCNTMYKISISNYTQVVDMKTSIHPNVTMTKTFSYEPNMAQKELAFEMSKADRTELESTIKNLPDKMVLKTSEMDKPKNLEHYTSIFVLLKGVETDKLKHEMMTFTGVKYGKSISIKSDENGKAHFYLPKGEIYTLNFKYHQNYASFETKDYKGVANVNLIYTYLGSEVIEARKKAEEERIAAKEKEYALELERFKKECERLGITELEGRKRELDELMSFYSNGNKVDTVISAVLNRNKWKNKLIVSDVTGSMQPYTAQLSMWYQLNYLSEKNLQFVFFNDGDHMDDNKKEIGNTGGIYYTKPVKVDALITFIAMATSSGSGGDCPENNMEALIKGTKMASEYDEIVMIVDNDAPVKDIRLLKEFDKPVHIILCGLNTFVLEDYLLIAWKTKGSVHTIDEDISKIAKINEGEVLKINGFEYKIMGGQFVRITKL